VRFWFSGANLDGGSTYNWRTVVQRRARSALFAQISAPRSAALARQANRPMPPLINPP
jgi:hypothetical protein